MAFGNVQWKDSTLISLLKNAGYDDRLRKLKLPTLKYTHLNGDMIKTYKHMTLAQLFRYNIDTLGYS